MILQSVIPNRIRDTKTDIEVVTTVFSFGPIRVTVISNIPKDDTDGTSYVKIELIPSFNDTMSTPRWSVFDPSRRE